VETAVGRGQTGPTDRGVAIACSLCGSPPPSWPDIRKLACTAAAAAHTASVIWNRSSSNAIGQTTFDDDHQRWFANRHGAICGIAEAIPQGRRYWTVDAVGEIFVAPA
jgi:hypothetical protein